MEINEVIKTQSGNYLVWITAATTSIFSFVDAEGNELKRTTASEFMRVAHWDGGILCKALDENYPDENILLQRIREKYKDKDILPAGYEKVTNQELAKRVEKYCQVLINSLNLASINVYYPYFSLGASKLRCSYQNRFMLGTSGACCSIGLITHQGILIGGVGSFKTYRDSNVAVYNDGMNKLIFECYGSRITGIDFPIDFFINESMLSSEMHRLLYDDFESDKKMLKCIYKEIEDLCEEETSCGSIPSVLMPHVVVL